MSGPSWDWSNLQAQAQAARGDPATVADRLRRAAASSDAPAAVLRLFASALRQTGRNHEARPVLQRLVDLQPASAAAEHNLAAALGDIGDAGGAEVAARRALSKGGDAPETWLVLGRALVGLSRLDEATSAFQAAIVRRPTYVDAARDLVQLTWMRSGDAEAALGLLGADGELAGADPSGLLRAQIAIDILGPDAGYRMLSPLLAETPQLHALLMAAAAAAEIDPKLALNHAGAAWRAAPGDPRTSLALASARLACGQAADAMPLLDGLLARAPNDQNAHALRYTAWRVLSDVNALSTSDYQDLACSYRLQPGDDPEWLDRTATALRALHPFVAQPFGQSVRSGAQSAIDPRYAGDPSIDAVFSALRHPLDDFVDQMENRTDPMSRRRGTGWDITGAWSVKLKGGGHHNDHVHPRGWVSSALHIVTPEKDPASPRAGWLRFGAVRLGVGLELPAEHWIEPRPGYVALFPSWMWHGTEPFAGAGERLTIAFDVEPLQ